jgi:fumarylacetoacetase
VVVSGTPIRRPVGQFKLEPEAPPVFGPTRMLDFELEVGFVTGGPGNRLGEPLDVARAEESIFGLVLVNDWSARDIQAWEYQPLGPFLGKSFATSISPWVVPLAALQPYRVEGPPQSPPPLPYLRAAEPRGLDLSLEVWLRTARMAMEGQTPVRISATSFRDVYWSMGQQLAHLTSNGATVGAGDLCASGTVSGATPGTEGSLMELTWRGSRPLVLPNGFLEDGDEVTMTGGCSGHGFGSVVGRVVGA